MMESLYWLWVGVATYASAFAFLFWMVWASVKLGEMWREWRARRRAERRPLANVLRRMK